MAKTPDITKFFTKKSRRVSYGNTVWNCNECAYTTTVYYDDYKNMRAHARRMHPRAYYSSIEFIINEEADHLWTAAK